MSAVTHPHTSSRGIPPSGEASGSQVKPQAVMSKAEQSRQRRAIQEQQRAAKAAKTANNPPGGATQKSGLKTPTAPPTPKKGGTGKPLKDAKDVGSLAGDELPGESRGLRIFSHFGLPKPINHVVKGDIHPAIIQLGLQFSEFKISGANARCIATLTAFKTARTYHTKFIILFV